MNTEKIIDEKNAQKMRSKPMVIEINILFVLII